MTYLEKLRLCREGKLTQKELDNWMQSMGVNSFLGELWKCPFYSGLTGSPQDMMHILFEGIVKQFLGALAYLLIRRWGVDPQDLKLNMQSYIKSHGLKPGDFPYLSSSRLAKLSEGQAGDIPDGDGEFPGTASQMYHLIVHAPNMWAPLVTQECKRTLPWQILLLEVEIARAIQAREFTTHSLLHLDKTIWIHDMAWLGCPDIQHMWKPKNHYLSHLPLEILRWGPPRGYWAMMFEHVNQFTKGDASHGNFANVGYSVAEGKALRLVLEARGRCKSGGSN